MERNEIREIVRETVRELMRNDMLKVNDYQEASALLAAHYAGAGDPAVGKALKALQGDRYFAILPLYYGQGKTIEQLAERFDCETSTISRNKKRLCLAVLKLL